MSWEKGHSLLGPGSLQSLTHMPPKGEGEQGKRGKGRMSEGAPAPRGNPSPSTGPEGSHTYADILSHTPLTCQARPEQYLRPADKQKALKHKHP